MPASFPVDVLFFLQAPLKFANAFARPFAQRCRNLLLPDSRTATTKMTRSSGSPIDLSIWPPSSFSFIVAETCPRANGNGTTRRKPSRKSARERVGTGKVSPGPFNPRCCVKSPSTNNHWRSTQSESPLAPLRSLRGVSGASRAASASPQKSPARSATGYGHGDALRGD